MNQSVVPLVQEAYKKIAWQVSYGQVFPSEEIQNLSRQIEDQYFSILFFRRFRFPWGRNFFYNRYKRKHPTDFAPLIPWEALRIERLTEFVPGNLITRTEIIGFFVHIPPSGEVFFPSPLFSLWTPLAETLSLLVTGLSQSSTPPHWLPTLQGHVHDFKALLDIALYFQQLANYSLQNHTPFLRSAHIFWWNEHALFIIQSLFAFLKQQGILGITINENLTVGFLFNQLIEKLRELRFRLLIDMYTPPFSENNVVIYLDSEKIILEDRRPLPTTWLSKLIDKLFPPKTLPQIATIRNAPQPEPSSPPRKIHEAIEEVVNRPSPDELDWSGVVLEAEEFLRARKLLQDFVRMLVADLSPRTNNQGQIIETKHRFDQFDVPPLMRRYDTNRFILKGKIKGLSPYEQQEQDELVIKSTHWLYDRTTDILERYTFSQVGVRGEIGKQFVKEIQGVFSASPDEYNETRKYGTFSQFRFNIKRIFSSLSIQNRYYTAIQHLESSLTKLKELIASHEIQLLQNNTSLVRKNLPPPP